MGTAAQRNAPCVLVCSCLCILRVVLLSTACTCGAASCRRSYPLLAAQRLASSVLVCARVSVSTRVVFLCMIVCTCSCTHFRARRCVLCLPSWLMWVCKQIPFRWLLFSICLHTH